MLNKEVILKRFYKEPEYYKRYKRMRVLAGNHLESCMKNDLITGDRGYPSYELACKRVKFFI